MVEVVKEGFLEEVMPDLRETQELTTGADVGWGWGEQYKQQSRGRKEHSRSFPAASPSFTLRSQIAPP